MSVIAVCRPVSTFPRFRSIWVPVCLRLLACVSRCVSAAWDCLCPDSDQRALLSLTVSSRLTPPDSGQHALLETYRGESYGTRVELSFTPFGRARLCCAGVDRISAICTSFLSALGMGPSAPLALVSLALLGFQCLVCNGRFFPPCVAQDCTPLATLLPFPKSAGL